VEHEAALTTARTGASVARLDFVRIAGILVTLSLVQPASVADKFPDYPVRQATDYPTKAEQAGLAIGVQPVEDLKEQKTYFHTELTPKGFIPVFVVLQNASDGESFLFDKSGITYGPADSSLSTPDAHSKAGERVAKASLATLSVTGALVAMKMISDASWIQENIVKKELQSKTLSPGTSTHGFVYVPSPKNAPREKIMLRFPVTRTSTGETISLELVF
jgi:hypothetical protein